MKYERVSPGDSPEKAQAVQVARDQLKHSLTIGVRHLPGETGQAETADVRLDQNDGMTVLVMKRGVIGSTLHWEHARILGKSIAAKIPECLTEQHRVIVLQNGLPLANMHRDYAKELAAQLIERAKEAEENHWAACERKAGRKIETRRVFGQPVLEHPNQIEQLPFERLPS